MPLYIRTTGDDIRQGDIDAECPLCYEVIGNTASGDMELMIILPCGHCYGHVCLARHLDTKYDCPLCRAPLPGPVLAVVQSLNGPSPLPSRRERVRDWISDYPDGDDLSLSDWFQHVMTDETPRPGRVSTDQLRVILQTHNQNPELYGPLSEPERYLAVLDDGFQQDSDEDDDVRATQDTPAHINLAVLYDAQIIGPRSYSRPQTTQDSADHVQAENTTASGRAITSDNEDTQALPSPLLQSTLRNQILALTAPPFLLAADIPWPAPLPANPGALLLAVSFIRHHYAPSAASEILGLMARLDASLPPPPGRELEWTAQWHTIAEYETWALGLEEGHERYQLARRLIQLAFEPCERIGESTG